VYQGYGHAPSFELPPEIMDNFRRFDTDGSGSLDPYEFSVVLSELHNFTEPYIPLVSSLLVGILYILFNIGSVFI